MTNRTPFSTSRRDQQARLAKAIAAVARAYSFGLRPRLKRFAVQKHRLVSGAKIAGRLAVADADAGVTNRRRQHHERRRAVLRRAAQMRDDRAVMGIFQIAFA